LSRLLSSVSAGFTGHSVKRYWKSGFDKEFSDDFIDALVEAALNLPSAISAITC
jgi:hypothetical protein